MRIEHFLIIALPSVYSQECCRKAVTCRSLQSISKYFYSSVVVLVRISFTVTVSIDPNKGTIDPFTVPHRLPISPMHCNLILEHRYIILEHRYIILEHRYMYHCTFNFNLAFFDPSLFFFSPPFLFLSFLLSSSLLLPSSICFLSSGIRKPSRRFSLTADSAKVGYSTFSFLNHFSDIFFLPSRAFIHTLH